jgi:glycosyltransferase involved in cell wall biosynthesis
LRILHISSARALGGGERHLIDLVQALAGRGHDVSVALRHGSPLRERLTRLPVQNIVTLPLRNALDIESSLRLASLVRERQIEIVHAHLARDYPQAALAAAAARNSSSLIITRHVLFPLKRIHRLTLSRVARVIAVSEPVAQALTARKIFPARKIAIVPNGIDLDRFDALKREHSREAVCRQLQLERESLLVGTVGEINPLKGQEEFLRAAARIAERRGDVHFIIAGADSSRRGVRREALECLVRDLKLEGRVHFTGWLEDVAPLLSALDVFVSASHTESFGLAMVEAMAGGAAIVASSTAGARSIIEDGVTGRLVPIRDVEALAENILRLLSDAAERSRLRDAARAVGRERFSLESMVTATEQVYRAALLRGR